MDNNSQPQGSYALPQPVQQGATNAGMPAESQVQVAAAPSTVTAPAAPAAAPSLAASGDVLESEWVKRVDQIVTQYIQDPQVMNEQLNLLRAQYIAGRYGKDTQHLIKQE